MPETGVKSDFAFCLGTLNEKTNSAWQSKAQLIQVQKVQINKLSTPNSNFIVLEKGEEIENQNFLSTYTVT